MTRHCYRRRLSLPVPNDTRDRVIRLMDAEISRLRHDIRSLIDEAADMAIEDQPQHIGALHGEVRA